MAALQPVPGAIGPAHEKQHEGSFAVGQEKAPHHPEWEHHGRHSRGQERGEYPP